ncbi:MAG: PEP-CTERM sorting domain-containing protein [Phycisphaerales bacterium]|nr:PEP-CTERM sorting domain-containing protein [Phycisphaerales bacterium]
MRSIFVARGVCALATIAGLAAATATADPLVGGLYRLHNHPDGNALPPPYGLRLDELYNATGNHDIFSFDFDHASSNVVMNYDSTNQIATISGSAWGGRDTGGSYANDQYLGLYSFTFTYNVGLGPVPGDDDIWATAPSGSNTGSILTPLGHTKALHDVAAGGYTFRFGDEDNDAGHRGFNGLSGWGWLGVDGHHQDSQDWLFTAERIPEPSSVLLLALGAGLLRRRR